MHPDQLGLDFLLLAGNGDIDFRSLFDNMGIGQHVTAPVDNDAGAEGLRLVDPGRTESAEKIFEK